MAADGLPMAGRRGLVALMGDSIPADSIDVSVNPPATMDSLLSMYLKTQVVNLAIGGTTAALRSDEYWSPLSFAAFAASIRGAAETGSPKVWQRHRAVAKLIGKKAAYQVDQIAKLDWRNVGALILMYGHNDYGVAHTPMGEDSSGNGATFKGAIYQGVKDILSVHPHVKPILVTPTYRDRFVLGALGKAKIDGDIMTVLDLDLKPEPIIRPGFTVYMDGVSVRTRVTAGSNRSFKLDRAFSLTERGFAVADDATNGDVYPNERGLRLSDYANAIRSMAGHLHCPVLDAYAESGFNYETAPRLTSDGLHPSPKVGLYELAHFIGRGAARHLV